MARLFQKILGHDFVKQRLLEMLARKAMPNTILLAGPSGIGKKLLAQALAQALTCPQSPLACGQCPHCERVENAQSENLLIIEPQNLGAPIKVEQARQCLDFVKLQRWSNARVALIDEAHLLNKQAGNTLLKTLEEPPDGTYFILISSHPHKVLPTLRSRSQIITLQSLSLDILKKLRPQTPAWVLNSSQGELTTIDQWSQHQELRESLLRFWWSQLSSKSSINFNQSSPSPQTTNPSNNKKNSSSSTFSSTSSSSSSSASLSWKELIDLITEERSNTQFAIFCLQTLIRDHLVAYLDLDELINSDQRECFDQFIAASTRSNEVISSSKQITQNQLNNTYPSSSSYSTSIFQPSFYLNLSHELLQMEKSLSLNGDRRLMFDHFWQQFSL